MNNAFDGKKDWHEALAKKDEAKDKRVKAILAEATKLDPILEEGAAGQDLVLYKPNMTLQEQRKLKNDELKRKVAIIT